MAMLKFARYVAWSLVVIFAFLSTALLLGWWQVEGPGRDRSADTGGIEIKGVPQIGGAFTLVNHRGEIVTEKTFLGRPTLLFFGFTHCPDVCPTTLFELTSRIQKLGASADRLNVVFITTDPERDTPEKMALYLQSFDPRMLGLSGTREQIDRVIAAYKVVATKVPLSGGGYNVDHTASVFMMDSEGRFAGFIDHHESEEMALAKMRRLVAA